jgi:aryl carrier-like protein
VTTLDQTSGQGADAKASGDIHGVVRGIVTDVTGMSVADDQSFFDIGLDSIQLMQICTSVNDVYGEVIDLFLLFEDPTINNCVAIVKEAVPQ